MLSILKESKRAFEAGDYVLALINLEKIWNELFLNNPDVLVNLHILLRELAGDYLGALSDINEYEIYNPVVKTRLLAKLGYFEEAKQIILNEISKSSANKEIRKSFIGLAGRRMDLLLNGISLDNKYDIEIEKIIDLYSVIEHLLSLSRTRYLKILNELTNTLANENIIYKLENENKLPIPSQEDLISISLIKGVRGWLSEDEAFVLFNLAKNTTDEKAIVEIGAWHGRSTLSLARGSTLGSQSRVYSVDTHEGLQGIGSKTYNALLENLYRSGLNDLVTIIKSRSDIAGKKWNHGPIGLLFIDAAHDYKSVKTDFSVWSKHLDNGSYVAFHDANQYGPNKLIRELLEHNENLIPVGYMDTLFVFQYFRDLGEKNGSRSFWIHFLNDRYTSYSTWIKLQENNLINQITMLYEKIEFNLLREENECI